MIFGVGSWQYASPVFPTANSLVIRCFRKLFYRYVYVVNGSQRTKRQECNIVKKVIKHAWLLREFSTFLSYKSMPFHIFGRDHLRSIWGLFLSRKNFGPILGSLEVLGSFVDPYRTFIFLCIHSIRGAGGIWGRGMPKSLASKGEGLAGKNVVRKERSMRASIIVKKSLQKCVK